MKKSFMTRVLAVSLSAAMAFSMSSASNLMTASAASTVNLKTTFKTLKVNQTYKMTLKNNTLNWKITKVTTSNKAICTVYGKTASSVMLKGKGVGRAKITVKVKTTKRKYPKNIKLMKCTANVKAADSGQTTEALSIVSAVANSNTDVSVTFNQAIDAAEAANFTISDTVSVTKAELSEDKKRVILTVAGAEYGKNYDLTVTGIKVAGKEQPQMKTTFVTPSSEEKYPRTLVANDTVLKSDGQSQTLVTFTINDENGNPITDECEVAFTASIGKFAEQRVTIQNGKATVMYTSEALQETQSAKLTARVVEVKAGGNQELMGLDAATSVTLTPSPEDTSIGALITSATAPTADRIIAYFNKEVKADDFKTSTGKLDTSKFECEIWSGLDNDWSIVGEDRTTGYKSQKVELVGIMDVATSEKNALQFLVSRPMQDNTNVSVRFRNKKDTNKDTVAQNTVYFKLTDARQPAAMSAKADGMRKIVVEFSEAVLPKDYCNNADEWKFAADEISNYTIDGLPLGDYWGVGETVITPETEKPDTVGNNVKRTSKKDATQTYATNVERDGKVTVGSYKDGKDTRHVVTIEVSRKRYLSAGSHSLEISNVGDWAAKYDRERNILNTQTLDIDVASNDLVPTIEEVVPQSPEQYLVRFNSDVEPVLGTDTIKTQDSATYPSLLRLQERINGTWVDISDERADAGKNPIVVSKIDDTNNYLVEVTEDWTKVYDTRSTRSNYFNKELRLYMAPNTIVNLANDKQNAAIEIPLTGDIMKTPDVMSPEIKGMTQATDENDNLLESYNVEFSEPVKLSNGFGTATGANIEGLTPNQTQETAGGGLGVPVPTAQFIRVDNGLTIEGIISDEAFINAEDTVINIAPATALSEGDWRLVVSSVSDDVGSTAATLTQTFPVTREAATSDFEVIWAAVSTSRAYNPNNINGLQGQYIFVKFNKPITRTGNSTNALVTGNYTINGSTLPTGTKIVANIQGYDDHVPNVVDSVTIILPTGNFDSNGNNNYVVNGTNAMLNISKAITCTTGANLANGGMIRIPFQYGAATGSNVDVSEITSLHTKTDAVWGNDPSEQYSGYNGYNGDENQLKNKDYYSALKSALESNKYRKVILTHDLNMNLDDVIAVFGRSHTLTINRAVDFDLNGFSIFDGNVAVSTTDIVRDMTISGKGTSQIQGYSKNRENVPSLKVTAGSIKEFTLSNVNVTKAGSSNLAIDINDTFQSTFKLQAAVTGDVAITDANTSGFETEGHGRISGTLYINTKGDVRLGDLSGLVNKVVEVNQAATIRVSEDTGKGGLVRFNVNKGSKDTRIIVTNDANIEIHAFTDVRVTIPSTATSVKCEKETGGNFVPVTKDNKPWSSSVSPSEAIDVNNASSFGGMSESDAKKALEGLNVLTLQMNDNTSTTITAGAISGDGLNVTAMEREIKELKPLGVTVTAEYTLMSSSVVRETRAGDDRVIIKQDHPVANGRDRIRVVLKCTEGGKEQTVTKYIEITEK